MNLIKRFFSKNKTTKQYNTDNDNSKLNHTITLGVTPSSFFHNNKPNFQMLNINYTSLDGDGDLVKITLEGGGDRYTVKISTQEAVDLGFINPYGLKSYCKKK